MSLEYTVLGLSGLDYQPEQWTPVDSLAWLKAMAWDLRGNMDDEIDRGSALGRPDAARRSTQLYPRYPYGRHAPIVGQGAVVGSVFEQDATGRRHPRAARPAYEAAARSALEPVRRGAATRSPT